jgi:hypothetical protein
MHGYWWGVSKGTSVVMEIDVRYSYPIGERPLVVLRYRCCLVFSWSTALGPVATVDPLR